MGRINYEPEYRMNRPLVLKRDRHRCVKCGSVLGLEVHHIEGYKKAELDALVTLCYLCHNIAPMGILEFAQWLLVGESGIESVERKLSQKGINNLSRDTVWKFLAVLADLGVETNKSRMKAARDRVRNSGMNCEGQKRFGYFPEEKPVLEYMKSLRADGLTIDRIAERLNGKKFLSRKGKPWRSATVNKILNREVPEFRRNKSKLKNT